MRNLALVLLFACGSALAGFATVESTSNGSATADSTPTLTMPATVSADAVLIACQAVDLAQTITWNTATFGTWTLLFQVAFTNEVNVECRAKLADGTEDSGTMDNTDSGAADTAWVVYSVIGWENDTVANGVEAGTAAQANDASPDPPSLTPSWGNKDTLWITVMGWDHTDTLTGYPYADNNVTATSGGAFPASVAFSSDELTGTSQNPGTYTLSGTDQWVANTIAVEPASSSNTPLRRRR